MAYYAMDLRTVKDIEEVKNTRQPLNSRADYWDLNEPIVYVKTVDNFGKEDIQICDITIRQAPPSPEAQELQAIKDDISSLREEIKKMSETMTEIWR